jgi:hypothetical protein
MWKGERILTKLHYRSNSLESPNAPVSSPSPTARFIEVVRSPAETKAKVVSIQVNDHPTQDIVYLQNNGHLHAIKGDNTTRRKFGEDIRYDAPSPQFDLICLNNTWIVTAEARMKYEHPAITISAIFYPDLIALEPDKPPPKPLTYSLPGKQSGSFGSMCAIDDTRIAVSVWDGDGWNGSYIYILEITKYGIRKSIKPIFSKQFYQEADYFNKHRIFDDIPTGILHHMCRVGNLLVSVTEYSIRIWDINTWETREKIFEDYKFMSGFGPLYNKHICPIGSKYVILLANNDKGIFTDKNKVINNDLLRVDCSTGTYEKLEFFEATGQKLNNERTLQTIDDSRVAITSGNMMYVVNINTQNIQTLQAASTFCNVYRYGPTYVISAHEDQKVRKWYIG